MSTQDETVPLLPTSTRRGSYTEHTAGASHVCENNDSELSESVPEPCSVSGKERASKWTPHTTLFMFLTMSLNCVLFVFYSSILPDYAKYIFYTVFTLIWIVIAGLWTMLRSALNELKHSLYERAVSDLELSVVIVINGILYDLFLHLAYKTDLIPPPLKMGIMLGWWAITGLLFGRVLIIHRRCALEAMPTTEVSEKV